MEKIKHKIDYVDQWEKIKINKIIFKEYDKCIFIEK